MAIKDILLPLVGEPNAAAIAAIDKCMAVAGDFGARVTAMAVEEVRRRGKPFWRAQRTAAQPAGFGGYSGEFRGVCAARGFVDGSGQIGWWPIGADRRTADI